MEPRPTPSASTARRKGEVRTIAVTAITGTMMAVDISAGLAFGSMALLADGLHMASHAATHRIKASEEIIIMGFELSDKPISPASILVNSKNRFLEFFPSSEDHLSKEKEPGLA